MDRQPLTDRLGDRLLAEYGGAAAAYSLRALNGNGDSVVRVRRASDNDEKDFTAEQIELGEMVNWVNSQTVPPLDIGVETSEGRIPVPEGGTSIGTPAAAYSLRNLSTTYTGNVVDVRRSSDDAVESFTAAEVADGTLEAWVNTNFNVKTYDFSSGAGGLAFPSNITLEGGESIAGVDDALKMSVVSTGGNDVHRCYQNLSSLGFGSSLRITFKAYRPSSNVNSGKLGFSFADGFFESNIEEQFFSADDTWEDFTFDANSGNTTRFYVQLSSTDGLGSLKSVFNGTTGDHVYIKDLKIDVVNSSGHVTKWYDQSGNDNHAVQTTPANQPTIVEGGVLVSGGLDFDGDFLSPPFLLPTIQDSFVTSVVTRRNTSTGYIAQLNRSSDRFYLRGALITLGDPAVNINTTLVNNEQSILSVTATNSGLFTGFKNGTSLGTTNYTGDVGGGDSTIGATDTGATGFDGLIAEIIVYRSDQSDNRTAIEANIGETYGITGIPAYDNTVDGFVETWYDQSGNGNHATQSVAASQPKIVDGGVLVSGGLDFDGVDDGLAVSGQVLTSSSLYAASVMQHATAVSTALGQNVFGQYQVNTSGRFQLSANNSAEYSFFANATDSISGLGTGTIGTSQTLISVNGDGSNAEIWRDGTSRATDTYSGFTPATVNFTIGIDSDGDREFNGKIAEVIIYPSDQSATRTAIEGNINAHYDIYA